ncbi:type 1 fimbrial protein [Serratia symbiotica]|uniref:type 1 fimbrial protein n=1 Tax=Serratia symbiotica TaxID=138074 RepID=UPI00077BEE8D|nr:type 1 fimbrial protein [Serratia symbiotica]
MNIFQLLVIVGMLFSWTAVSQAGVIGGVIRFVGSIVESPCTVNIADSKANTQCYRNGKHYQAQQTLKNFGATRNELPLNLGTTETKWLDKKKKLAVMSNAGHLR